MADVFISYAREDRDRAEQLAQALTMRGWSVWWDRQIKLGKHFSRVIEAELDAARCVVVLWSRHAVDSEWVLNEASEGARRQVLVPVRIDDSKLPLEFRRLQTADLTAWHPGVESMDLNDCIAVIGEYAPLTVVSPEVAAHETREHELREREAKKQEALERAARDHAAQQHAEAKRVATEQRVAAEPEIPRTGVSAANPPAQKPPLRSNRLLTTFLGCVSLFAALIVFITMNSCPRKSRETSPDTTTTTSSQSDTTDTVDRATARITDTGRESASLTVDQRARTTVDLETTVGTISLELRPDVAPNHVRNFVDLAQSGFYDGTRFHRVIPGFMIQGGDPNTKSSPPETWGTGGSGTNIKAEFNSLPHLRGTLSMARSQHPDSANSQFFICDAPAQMLDWKYTVFGRVSAGMDVVDRIARAPRNANDRPNDPVTIVRVVVHLPQR